MYARSEDRNLARRQKSVAMSHRGRQRNRQNPFGCCWLSLRCRSENVLCPFAAPFQTVLAQNILKSSVEFVPIAIRMSGYVGARCTRARRTETWPDGKRALQ